jgi:methylmalonyl-CoA/ethylmalonyl-CoA epimerase
MRFHHIGYAVSSITEYLDSFFLEAFAPIHVSAPVADSIQRVRVCFAQMHPSSAGPFGALIELVEPLGEDSPIMSIVGSQRGGLYHLCYEVDDLDGTLRRLRRMRCLPLSRPVPAAAFDDRRIVFVMTPQHDLIELLEAPGTKGATSK